MADPFSTEITVTLTWTDLSGEHLQSYLEVQVEFYADVGPQKFKVDGSRKPDDLKGPLGDGSHNNAQKVVWRGIQKGLLKINVYYFGICPVAEEMPFALVWTLCDVGK